MTTKEYLENLFKALNEGKITPEVYDVAISNIDEFCEDE